MSEVIKLPSRDVRGPSNSGISISISNAADTAASTERYAEQLRKEFYEVLYKPLARTDLKVAGRFSSLIDELFFMASQTSRNLKGDR